MYTMMPFARTSGLSNLFDEFERSFFPTERYHSPAFRTDIQDKGDHYLLQADLPGFQKENIDLDVKDGMLTISAKQDEAREEKNEDGKYLCRERRYGSFSRSFDISGIQEDAIAAAYDNGVLKLTLPKVIDAEPQSRKIAIQ